MKRTAIFCGCLLLVLIALICTVSTTASSQSSASDNVPDGGTFYDNWADVSGQQAPNANFIVWSSQNTNPLSGLDTWHCVTCHGENFQGKGGAELSGANYTDIKAATIADNQTIDPMTYEVIAGDAVNGKNLYESTCASCHGEDGGKITLSFEGVQAGLGTLAAIDPWRFLQKTRFGDPGTPMVIGYTLGWKPLDGRDVLLYAHQTFKTVLERPTTLPVMPVNQTPAGLVDRPAQNWFTGILTAIGAVMDSSGFPFMLGAILAIIIFIILLSMRNHK